MKTAPIYQVDAFASGLFKGNPAAVCLFDTYPAENVMQQIAAENNLAETAFVMPYNDHFFIRWFTPKAEVALCGHATLAAASVLLNKHTQLDLIRFETKYSGILTVAKTEKGLEMDFPVDKCHPAALPLDVLNAFNIPPKAVLKGKTDYLLVYRSEKEVTQLKPDLMALSKADARGFIVTAEGDECDFVSRFFAPAIGIPEDPVTGSAHTTLIPYWSQKLNKTSLFAKQCSQRGGELHCSITTDRVKISGKTVLFMEGTMYYDQSN